MTERAATHHNNPVACVSMGANWQFLIPVTHSTYEELEGLVTRSSSSLRSPGQNAYDCAVETLSAVPTTGPRCEERDR